MKLRQDFDGRVMRTSVKIQSLNISVLDKDSLFVPGILPEEIQLLLITKEDADALYVTHKVST